MSAPRPTQSLDPPVAPEGAELPPVQAATFIPNWDTTPKEVEPESKLPRIVSIVSVAVLAVSAAGVGARALLAPDAPPLTIAEERAAGDAWLKAGPASLGGPVSGGLHGEVSKAVAAVGARALIGGRAVRAIVVKEEKSAVWFTLPDATLVVGPAALLALENQAEFAALFAHDLGHIALGHTAAALTPQADVLRNEILSGAASVLASAAYAAATRTHTIEEETAADRFALKLLVDAGFDPTALGALLKRLPNAASLSGYVARHPVSAARTADASRGTASGRSGAAEYKRQVLDVIKPPPPPPPAPVDPEAEAEKEATAQAIEQQQKLNAERAARGDEDDDEDDDDGGNGKAVRAAPEPPMKKEPPREPPPRKHLNKKKKAR